jgi:hypothetical protein
MTDTKHWELQRRRWAHERKAHRNRVSSHQVGSRNHLLVVCVELLRNQPPGTNVIAAAAMIGVGGVFQAGVHETAASSWGVGRCQQPLKSIAMNPTNRTDHQIGYRNEHSAKCPGSAAVSMD